MQKGSMPCNSTAQSHRKQHHRPPGDGISRGKHTPGTQGAVGELPESSRESARKQPKNCQNRAKLSGNDCNNKPKNTSAPAFRPELVNAYCYKLAMAIFSYPRMAFLFSGCKDRQIN